MHIPLYYIVENNNFKFIDYILIEITEKKFFYKNTKDENNLSPLRLLKKIFLIKHF